MCGTARTRAGFHVVAVHALPCSATTFDRTWQGHSSTRAIARLSGRSVSTVSRELARNRDAVAPGSCGPPPPIPSSPRSSVYATLFLGRDTSRLRIPPDF
ncbi:helix-turn-helix domain-containing protein [Trinickia fusca]|uniref:Transposase IS30-like HTH domain-containing protein n=1 Tax=Trinickia fusca TaxID=2419777 RepID=A0A494XF09_9BURK|nr:hypothetical protein D7S89_11535 [Trinickia fusca]